MTTLEIVFLALPIVGNIVALILRALGYQHAADRVDQATPLALRLGKAAADKNREQAIGAALDALAIASTELGPDHPVSKVEGQIRKHLRPSNPPPPAPPPLPLLLLVFVIGCVPLLGCGSPLKALVVTTDAAAVAGEAARPILREACTEPAEALVRRLDAADKAGNVDASRVVRIEAAALAEHCDPAAAGLALLLRLHAAARAAIVAYHATGGPPPGLAGIVVSLAQASMDLGLALEKLGKDGAK